MSADDRMPTFRWANVNNRRRQHLWLGQSTACGLVYSDDAWRLEVAYPETPCKPCWTYLRGWLDRHDYGANPRLGQQSDPTGYSTRLARTETPDV